MRRADRLFQIIQVLRRTAQTADGGCDRGRARDLEAHDLSRHRDPDRTARADPRRGRHGLYPGEGIRPAAPDAHPRRDRGGRARRAMGRRPCRRSAGARRAGSDGENRRHRPRTPAAVRAGTREPRASRLEQGTRPHRHGADARADPRGQEDHAALSRRTRPRQRAHHLADRRSAITRRCGFWRHGASCAGISAAFAPTASSRRCITTKNIRSGATCCGRDGAGAWSGRRRRISDGGYPMAVRFIPR